MTSGALAAVLFLGACDALDTDKTPQRARDGISSLQLSVTGSPTPGSLSAAEHVLARLQAKDAKGLAKLSLDDGGAEKAARAWVKEWGDLAQQPMTADFSEPVKSVWVEVTFKGERRKLSFTLEGKSDSYDDRFGVLLKKD
ncbi:hypothetical protein [Streptomyces sp. CAU 1734]|uniref:hypothetical protein n=1 Tax=Streptomyces sp. CAU 1734 TaxID=3140360 RepID=UPI0032618165